MGTILQKSLEKVSGDNRQKSLEKFAAIDLVRHTRPSKYDLDLM